MKKRLVFFVGCLLLLSGVMVTAWVGAEEDSEWLLEVGEAYGGLASYGKTNEDCWFVAEQGVYVCPIPLPNVLPVPDPAKHALALERLMETGLLLVVDTTNVRVMAFDPLTGDLLDENFIPSDPTNLDLPYNAIYNPNSETILVNSYGDDLIQEYDLAGNFVGSFAPAGGPNTAQLDTPRGIAWRENGNLLVAAKLLPSIDTVIEFDRNGNYLGLFVADGAGGLDSPYDLYGRDADWLVSGAFSDAVHRYDLNGAYLDDFAAVDGFPEQIAEAANGNVLVANFSGGQRGVVEFDPAGNLIAVHDALGAGTRGVYELPNGNLLVTSGTGTGGVYEIDRAGTLVDTKFTGSITPRHIEFMPAPANLTMTMTVGLDPAGCATSDTLTVTGTTDVTYCYTISNTGASTLTTHDLADSQLGDILADFAFSLVPGNTTFVTVTTAIDATITSTATWTATTTFGSTAMASDSATVTVEPIQRFLPILSKP